jgi:hypothetical protein
MSNAICTEASNHNLYQGKVVDVICSNEGVGVANIFI